MAEQDLTDTLTQTPFLAFLRGSVRIDLLRKREVGLSCTRLATVVLTFSEVYCIGSEVV